jgi:IS4 transposase
VVLKLGRHDKLVKLFSSPKARTLWPELPKEIVVRLVSRKNQGKQYDVLTSMVAPKRYPCADIADLYTHRWEIELGYREQKQ